MPRSRPAPLPDAKVPADPILLGLDLSEWAGRRIAKGGRRDALLGRVETLRLSLDGRSADARVRGSRPLPYLVRVWVDRDKVLARCTCSREAPGPCSHAVAALQALRFPLPKRSAPGRKRAPGRAAAGRGRIVQPAAAVPGFVILGGAERTWTRDERIAMARDEELARRRSQARRDRATVEPLPTTGAEPLKFEVRRKRDDPQIVTLRGPNGDRASCSCWDFAANELALCKHIHRVRSWRSRHKGDTLPAAPEGLLSVWCYPRSWNDRVPDALAEIRIDPPGEQRPSELATRFNASGWLLPCPEARKRSDWAQEAVEAAREVARGNNWSLDLDPAVEGRIHQVAEAEQRAVSLAATERNGELWRSATDGLGFKLHPYQEEGARFLARTGRAFLADDMGLGKTVQAIVASLLLRRTAGARRALVVCPASIKHQWSREIALACGELAQVVEGPRSRRLETYAAWSEGFLILNYELVLRDLDAIRDTGAELIILDEAQRIKNWDTKTARAVKQLRGRHAFVLTGTPLENRLLELHSLAEFLHPHALGPRWRLLPFHAVTETGGRVLAYEGLDVLRRRLSGFFLRRDRESVLDQLPGRTDNTFWTGMTAAQKRPYRRHAATAAALVSRKHQLAPQDVRALFRALTSMRILCNAHAQYDWASHQERLRESEPPTEQELQALYSPKLDEFARVLEDLLDESEERIVVFSQWERMLRLAHFAVRSVLADRGLDADVFHGGLNSRSRGAMLEAFGSDARFRVLFSTDAGGLGLNLQDAASIVVNLEVPWNPAVLEQRIGRVHRIGQRRSVQVLHFVTRDAIEERVRQVVEDKRALFEGLLVDEANEVVLEGRLPNTLLDRIRSLIEGNRQTGTFDLVQDF